LLLLRLRLVLAASARLVIGILKAFWPPDGQIIIMVPNRQASALSQAEKRAMPAIQSLQQEDPTKIEFQTCVSAQILLWSNFPWSFGGCQKQPKLAGWRLSSGCYLKKSRSRVEMNQQSFATA
jgi:hypothetical protein